MMKHITACILIYWMSLVNIYPQASFASDEIILKFNHEVQLDFEHREDGNSFNLHAVDNLNQRYGVESIVPLASSKASPRCFILKFTETVNIESVIESYKNTNLFEYVEPNFIGSGAGQSCEEELYPGDTYFSRQYGLHNNGSFTLSPAEVDADIDMIEAWDIEQGDSEIIVAVLDAGTRMNHPEFAGRIWTNPAETNNGMDSDNNGYVDDVVGWDFVNEDNDPTDDHGHGTNVAGIAVSNGDNMLGYAGVDWNCKLMTCKILDSNNSGLYSWWTAAIYYAVDQGARVINMSVGGNFYSFSMDEALTYAHEQGVVVVASMMNFNNSSTYYPASYEETIAVGSTDADDNRTEPFFWSATSGSNYGSHIDVVAPGNYIYGLNYQSNNNYNTYWGGTSQATPLVTGLASLLLAQDASRTPDEIRNIIRSTAEDEVGDPNEDIPGFDHYYGYGRINAYEALMQMPSNITNENKINTAIAVFPNPAASTFNIVSDIDLTKLVIHNHLGQLIRIVKFDRFQKSASVGVADFLPGLYTLHFYNKFDELIIVDKLVVD